MTVTDAEARVWVRQYEDDGLTIEEIALEARRSTQTVRKWLVRLNYTPRRPGQREGTRPLNLAHHEPRDQHWLRPSARIVQPRVVRGYR